MSVVINYVSEFISIIATDTRISWGKNAEYGYDDDNEKLVDLPQMGWTSGVGLGWFLDTFKENLAAEEISNPAQIEEIYSQAIMETMESRPGFEEEINKSALAASWIGLSEERDKVFCRIGLLNKELFGEVIKLLPFNQLFVLYPWEYLENPERANEFEGRYSFYHEFDGDIIAILKKICSMFDELSETKSVSKICDIGVQFIAPDGIYKIRIREDIQLIIDELNKDIIPGKFTKHVNFKIESV
ncbi:hypothetical protein [Neobacillus sp. YIM B06451]|uniref:hypothetical protein n=1 Tax=Neobacillus sp. YIM B06451 TaxID=3070994 RepID=UPI002931F6BE|nr:hypothetical protein [Neobacillus sp. YIM B06451]